MCIWIPACRSNFKSCWRAASTSCSTSALRALVTSLGRKGFICAQVAVHPLEEVCFPHYVVLDEKNMDQSVAKFGELIMKLVTRGQA